MADNVVRKRHQFYVHTPPDAADAEDTGADATDQAADEPEEDQYSLGMRLRSARVAHGYSVRRLAREAHVSASLISEAERGLTEPSVAVLKRLASALGVTMPYFFTRPGMYGETVIRADQHPKLPSLKGVEYELLGPEGSELMEPIRGRLEPGAGLKDTTMMTHGNGEEWGMVVSGRLKVWVGSEVYVLGPGDTVYFSSSVPHRVANLSDEVTEYIWVNSPPTF
jgi:transcriptional regulator with XRE-family HTH domain